MSAVGENDEAEGKLSGYFRGLERGQTGLTRKARTGIGLTARVSGFVP